MDVQLLVTKDDFCVPNLESEFKNIGVDYRIDFIEDNEELAESLQIRHSPNVFIDGDLVFRYQPSQKELEDYFSSYYLCARYLIPIR